MANATTPSPVPPPPTCTLTPRSPLIAGVSDQVLGTVLPTLVYIIASGFFYWLGEQDLLSQYRIHPSEEELKRNHVSRSQCLRVAVRYHVMQIATGVLLSYGEGPALTGNHSCDVYRWAVRVRQARRAIPWALALVGVDAKGLALATYTKSAGLAQLLAGNSMAFSESKSPQASFTPGELFLAESIVSYAVPALQFLVALSVVDTWIYFTHRLCHVNKTLYRIVHAQHHQLYVSYAYGAVYAHWLESIFLDIMSFVMANAIAGLSVRQSMVFGSLATIKTISDHCGYVFPLDPFRYVNNNGANFHDLHHQTWGLKSNFSTYTVFWDNLLGTTWTDEAGAAASSVHVVPRFPTQDEKCRKSCKNLTMLIGFLTAFPLSVAMMYGVTDINAVVTSALPNAEVFYQVTESKPVVTFMMCWIILIYYSCLTSQRVTAGRMTWAFARDNGIPFSPYFTQLSSKQKSPVRATFLSLCFCSFYGLLYLASTTAFNSIVTSAVLFLNITYAVPQGIIVSRGRKNSLPARPFDLGRLGYACNVLTPLLVTFVGIFICFPPELPVTVGNMNYTPVILVGLFLVILGFWFTTGRKFMGPRIDWEGLGLADS